MVYKRIKSSQVPMSPAKAIQRFENILHRDGVKRATEAVSFQKAREAWIAGVFLLGYSSITKELWWLQEVEDDPPDIIASTYRRPKNKGEKGVVKERALLEICEYPVQSKYKLGEHIANKLSNKLYHPETWLVCYIRRPGEHMRLVDPMKLLQKTEVKIREIWIVFHVQNEMPTRFRIARLYSKGFKFDETPILVEGDYKELAKKRQPELLEESLGTSKEVVYTPGEKVIMPLPTDTTLGKK